MRRRKLGEGRSWDKKCRPKEKQVQRSGGSKLSVPPGALPGGGVGAGDQAAKPRFVCGWVGCDKGFGFFLAAAINQWRTSIRGMP